MARGEFFMVFPRQLNPNAADMFPKMAKTKINWFDRITRLPTEEMAARLNQDSGAVTVSRVDLAASFDCAEVEARRTYLAELRALLSQEYVTYIMFTKEYNLLPRV